MLRTGFERHAAGLCRGGYVAFNLGCLLLLTRGERRR